MIPRVDPKVWAAMQASAALVGMQLLRSEGVSIIVVLIDRKGAAHRVHTAEQLEDAFLAAEFARQRA